MMPLNTAPIALFFGLAGLPAFFGGPDREGLPFLLDGPEDRGPIAKFDPTAGLLQRHFGKHKRFTVPNPAREHTTIGKPTPLREHAERPGLRIEGIIGEE